MGQYCFARWRLSASSVGVCNAAGRVGGAVSALAVGWSILHGSPLWLHPVRVTPCLQRFAAEQVEVESHGEMANPRSPGKQPLR